MGDSGIVHQDRDGAESLLGLVEGARHRGAVEHVGRDGDRAAAPRHDFVFERGEPLGAPRHQGDRGAVLGQHHGKAGAETA